MRLISRHILRTIAAPFIWGVAALTGLMLLNALPPLIDAFGGKGIPVATMVEGVLLFLPALLALTLPMAVLVSVLYGYSQLAANLEMVAMYANGLSVWRMARPALIGAAMVALVNFLVFDQLMPQSNARFASLRDAIQHKTPTLALRQQALNVVPSSNGAPGIIIRADAIEPESGKMRRVTIIDLSQYDTRRLIHADSGNMAESANGKDLILTLHSGVIYEFKRDEPGRVQQTLFVHSRVTEKDVQNDLERSRRISSNRGEREMTSCELLDAATDQSWILAKAQQDREYYTRRDLRALASLPPVLQPAEQAQPKKVAHCGAYRRFESWIKQALMPQPLAAQVPQKPAAPQNPVIPPPPTIVVQPPAPEPFLVPPGGSQQNTPMLTSFAMVQLAQIQANSAYKSLLLYRVEFHQKFAVPLSCFCFVLIGVSLALKYPTSGIGLVIGGSLVIFLGFYIMLQGGKAVAQSGQFDPAVTMYTPLVLFTVIGILAVNSANREMGTARSAGVFDSVIEFYHKLRGS